ncbi:unnamed protein product [Cylindrotheca closterium]|uniref:CWH43-like N-terminal domain-containing protein n=1 Tax=Cylindrotheca closterium TaxID=2856 RepID=A0AAD2FZ17_9STRA|nr:unnamed protein product [Cylindrotheca closterium]
MTNSLFALLPLGIFFVALITIIAAYIAAFGNGDMDFLNGRIKTPPISMLMYRGAGKRIGQVGFSVVSMLGFTCLPQFFRGVERIVGDRETHKWTLGFLRISISIAFANLAIVGLLPLQADLHLAMKKEVPISWQSIIHQGAAGIFFLTGIMHMGSWIYFVTRSCSDRLPFHHKNSPKSFRFKLICFVLCFLPLPAAMLLHPISPLRKKLSLSKADSGGITQYALVACVSSFFASYSCELWMMTHPKNPPMKEKI